MGTTLTVSTEVYGKHRDFVITDWGICDTDDVAGPLGEYIDEYDVGLSPFGTITKQVTAMLNLVASGKVSNASLVAPISDTDDMTIWVKMETADDE